MFFENSSLIWLICLPVISLGALLLAYRKNKKTASLLLHSGLRKGSESKTGYRLKKIINITLVTLVLSFATIAALKPVSDPTLKEIKKEGSDIIFLVDVSKSMLAEDLIPSRIERVKIELTRLLENADGDRIGLIVFSGSPVLKSPLTIDYGYLHSAIETLSVQSVSRGGTELSRALNYAIETGFDEVAGGGKDIILISDGETHDSGAVEIAKKAKESKIGLTIIGLGDPVTGAKIPIVNDKGEKTFLKHNGTPVLTKLNQSLLQDMAKAANGELLSISSGSFDLTEIYKQVSRKREKRLSGSMKITIYEERFQLFLLIAIVLMILSYGAGFIYTFLEKRPWRRDYESKK